MKHKTNTNTITHINTQTPTQQTHNNKQTPIHTNKQNSTIQKQTITNIINTKQPNKQQQSNQTKHKQ